MKLLTGDPFSYNSISLKKQNDKKVNVNATADVIKGNRLYNTVGKFLGVQSNSDWSQYYQLVQDIVNWACQEAGESSPEKVVKVLTKKLNKIPSMNDKRIIDLHIAIQLTEKKKNGKYHN